MIHRCCIYIYIVCVYIVYIVTADFEGKSALHISGVLVVFNVYLWFIGMGMFIIKSKHAYVFHTHGVCLFGVDFNDSCGQTICMVL